MNHALAAEATSQRRIALNVLAFQQLAAVNSQSANGLFLSKSALPQVGSTGYELAPQFERLISVP